MVVQKWEHVCRATEAPRSDASDAVKRLCNGRHMRVMPDIRRCGRTALETVVGPVQDADMHAALEAAAKLRVGPFPLAECGREICLLLSQQAHGGVSPSPASTRVRSRMVATASLCQS